MSTLRATPTAQMSSETGRGTCVTHRPPSRSRRSADPAASFADIITPGDTSNEGPTWQGKGKITCESVPDRGSSTTATDHRLCGRPQTLRVAVPGLKS